MISVLDFCNKFRACDPGLDWSKNYASMLDVWNDAPPDYLFWVATRPSVLNTNEELLLRDYCLDRLYSVIADESLRSIIQNIKLDSDLVQRLVVPADSDDAHFYYHNALNHAIDFSLFNQIYDTLRSLAFDSPNHRADMIRYKAEFCDYIRQNITPNFDI